MHRIFRLQCLLILIGFLTDLSSANVVLPIFSPQPMISSRIPFTSAVMIPPSSRTRQTVRNFPGSLPAVSRRQGEEMPLDLSKEKEPTCSELRSMWRKSRRISRQMELTNEIPRVQDPFVTSAYTYRPHKYPMANPYSAAKSSKYKVFQTPNSAFDIVNGHRNFGRIISNPEEPRFASSKNEVTRGGMGFVKSSDPIPSAIGFGPMDTEIQDATYGGHMRIPGRFTNRPILEEALGVYGTVVNSPEERARFRSITRRPTDASSFKTRMLATGSGSRSTTGRVPFKATRPHTGYHYGTEVTHSFNGRRNSLEEYPTDIGQRAPLNPMRVERIVRIGGADKPKKNFCFKIQNKTCKNDVECYCEGNPQLFCGGNRCRPRFKAIRNGRKAKNERFYYADPRDIMDDGFKMDPFWPTPF